MGKVSFNISMSLDGYINGPDVTPEQGLGKGGERLHEWAFNGNERNREVLDSVHAIGAIIAGRRTYDLPSRGGALTARPVSCASRSLSSRTRPRTTCRTRCLHVRDRGIEDVLEQAEAAAGARASP